MASAKRIASGVLRWAVVVLAVVALLIVVLLGALQTRPGRRYAVGLVAARIGTAFNSEASLEGVEGRLPYNTRIERVVLQDGEGVWATLENVYLDWAPGALLGGEITINELSAQAVRLERIPREENKPFQLPRLPQKVPRLTVRKFDVARLALSEQLAGVPIVLTAAGSIDYVESTRGIQAHVRVNGIEGPPVEGRATLALQTAPTPALEINVLYDEPQQGPVGHWLGAESGPVTVRVTGAGPLDGWTGQLSATAAGRQIVQTRVRLAKTQTAAPEQEPERLALTAEGQMTVPQAILPANLQPILGIQNNFAVTAQFAPGEQLNVDNAAISSLLGNLKTSGNIDFKTGAVDIQFSTTIDDLTAVQDLAGVTLAGALSANGTVTGNIKQPVVNVTVQATNLKLGEASAETFAGQLRFDALEKWEGQLGRGQFSGEGTLTGFAFGDAPYLPARDFDWRLQGQTYADGRVAVEQFVLQNPAVTLTFKGDYNVNSKKASFNMEFSSEEIKPISSAFGLELEGAARLSAEGEANLADKTAKARLNASFSRLSGLPAAAAAVIGESLEASGSVEVAGGKPVFFRDVNVDTQHAAVRAEGSYNPESKAIDASAQVELPDLAVFEKVAGRPIAGALALEIKAEGTTENLRLLAEADGQNVTVAGAPVQLLSARAELTGLPDAPQGNVRLAATWRGEEVTARADIDSEPPRLHVSGIRIAAPGLAMTGAVTANMETWRLDGALAGAAEDLAPLGAAAGMELAGAGRFDLRLHARDRQQNLALDLEATGVATPAAAIERLELNADLKDVYQTPVGEVSVRAARISGHGFQLENLSVQYEGGAHEGVVVAETRGLVQKPLELAARAEWRREQSRATIGLTELSGGWGEFPFNLDQPAVLQFDPQGGRLQQAALRFGPGEIRAQGAYADGRVEGDLAFSRLPLDALQSEPGQGIAGMAEGTVRIEGPAGGPTVSADLQLTALGRLPPLQNAPPVDITLQAVYEPNRVEGRVAIERLFETPVEGRFSAPLVLSVAPLNLQVPQHEPLAAKLNFDGRLERIASLAVLEDHQISGDVRGRLEISGTPAAPVMTGNVEVSDGAYENFATGAILRNLNARLLAENSIVRIVSATADDGRGGTVAATGELALDISAGMPVDARVVLENFRAVRREDMTADATGTLDIEGRLSQLRIAGQLAVEPVEISLVQWRSSPVEALEVVDVNVPPRLLDEVAVLNPEPEAPDAPPLFQNIALDVELNIRRATVSGYGVESEWHGDISAAGTVAAPVLTGELTAERGQMTFGGKTFQLEEGAIVLRGESPPDPLLNIAAQHEQREFTAVLRISGSAADPRIALESTPQLPEDEILSHVLFGRDLAQVSPVQALHLARTLNAMRTGRESPGLVGRIGRTLGLEGLILHDIGGEGGLGLTFGRYLGENVYLNIEQGFDETARAVLEIEINRYLSLESTFSERGGTGASLNWKKDY